MSAVGRKLPLNCLKIQLPESIPVSTLTNLENNPF